jgi:hypothetical protein
MKKELRQLHDKDKKMKYDLIHLKFRPPPSKWLS